MQIMVAVLKRLTSGTDATLPTARVLPGQVSPSRRRPRTPPPVPRLFPPALPRTSVLDGALRRRAASARKGPVGQDEEKERTLFGVSITLTLGVSITLLGEQEQLVPFGR